MATRIPLALLATALACSLFAAPAHALRARVFVSKTGADTGTCSFSAPCQSLNFAYNAVLPGGEITMLDNAGYEPLTINKALTITGPAGVEAGIAVPSGGNAITISAGPTDAVVLRGLTLNGGGIGYNGIVFNAGGSLTVTDCVVQNFAYSGSGYNTGNGILMQPASGAISFVITNTVVLNNALVGIFYVPPSGTATAIGVIDHVVATNHPYGIEINNSLGGGSTAVAISNSIVNNSSAVGIDIENGAALAVAIDNTSISSNTNGIKTSGTPNVTLGRSVITANGDGINNGTSTFFSYLDNRINRNENDVFGTALTSHALK